MPTYEYECAKCGVFERFQNMSEKPLAKCPECKGKVKRLLGTGAGLLFKGSGFYETDYRSDSYKSGEKKAEPKPDASADSGAKSKESSTSTDTKKKAKGATKSGSSKKAD